MTRNHEPSKVVLLGANGRVGRLLSKTWGKTLNLSILTQGRQGHHDLVWDPIAEPAATFSSFLDAMVSVQGVLVFFGPGSHASAEELAGSNLATLIALKAAITAQIPRVFVASSSAVYRPGSNLNESAPLAPVGTYGAAKCDLEAEINQLDPGQTEIIRLRIGNVAGADALLGQVVGRNCSEPLQIDRFADGCGPIRSYISPRMLADVLVSLLNHAGPLPGILNIGANQPVDMADLAQAAGLKWDWRDAPREKAPLQRITLDCTALSRLVGRDLIETTPEQIISDLRQVGALA